MKIIFMGSPATAARILEDLISSYKNIIAVVTQPDKPKGRGLKITQSDVSSVAQDNSIATFKPKKISDPDFIKKISDLKPDLIIIVAYGKILPKELLAIPKYGCINVHASLLPKYRGASPIQAALLNGDRVTGVTIMDVSERLDAGDIIVRQIVNISDDDNANSLSEKLFNSGSKLLLQTLSDIEKRTHKKTPQNEAEATYTKTIKKEDGQIDFSLTADEIHNKIRAFYPWPGAFTFYKRKKVKIIRSTLTPLSSLPQGEGIIVEISKDKGLVVSTGHGLLSILELQPENSKKMSAMEFVSGYRVKIGDRFNLV